MNLINITLKLILNNFTKKKILLFSLQVSHHHHYFSNFINLLRIIDVEKGMKILFHK
jgi:hypothetical protein